MNTRIEVGDIVDAHMTDGEVFRKYTVIYKPVAIGDSWTLTNEHGTHTIDVCLFAYMVLVQKIVKPLQDKNLVK